MKFRNLKADISDEKVLKKLNCSPESPLYEEFLEEYLEIKEEMLAQVSPVSAMAFGNVTEKTETEEYPAGTRVVFVITQIGEAISQYANLFFEEGDFVKGMLADAFADTYLFELEKSWSSQLIQACRQAGVGIEKRLEVPGDLPMEIQKEAYEAIGAEELPDMLISDHYMFYPVKTLCQVYLLTDKKDVFHVAHNCRSCRNTECSMREVHPAEILVHSRTETFSIVCKGEERILDSLQKVQQGYSAVCGKLGRCGKCKIRVISGEVPPSLEDKAYFQKEELEAGYRLSCKAYPMGDCEIELLFEKEEFEVLTDSREKENEEATGQQGYAVAIDLGTTTIAAQLVNLSTGKTEADAVSLNHQRVFGADVISRIQASNQGKGQELKTCVQRDLSGVIRSLMQTECMKDQKPERIGIAGNTTMGHLLMGYSCESLGHLPFVPVNIDEITASAGEIFGTEAEKAGLAPDTNVCLLPGISAFVGGDILAGLLSCGFDQKEKPCFFLDLGTNGEMAVGNKERILVTSTAAGPAFEGGNIQWGRGSVPGAICHVEIREGETCQVGTIGNQAPIGICGSGLIEAAAELLRRELMDETGRLTQRYVASGYPLARTEEGETIVLTQRDIRELQLAKAAIRAGMEILLKKYGISYADLDCVYLGGGFGHGMKQEKAAEIGLLPKEILSRIEVVGNASLAGTKQYLLQKGAVQRAAYLREISQEIILATEKDFQEVYVDAMYFED